MKDRIATYPGVKFRPTQKLHEPGCFHLKPEARRPHVKSRKATPAELKSMSRCLVC